jgi:hypothetical protein
MKNVDPVATQQYIEKADHFLKGMKLLNDDVRSYRSGIGLLAVHSAISLSDAVTVGLTGKRGKYQDHAQAARELNRLCASHKISSRQGIDHLKWLLAIKNSVAYEHARVDDDSIRLAVDKAERFNAWAYNYSRRFCVPYKRGLSLEQEHARAETAVAELLFRQLIVPKVFVEAHWPGARDVVDVMAVDRSGSGEVHVVEVAIGTQPLATIGKVVARLLHVPAHFKYLAIFDNKNYLPDERWLYAPDGMGRVGVIQVKENSAGDLSAEFRLRPERFRFDATFKQVDKFTAAHPAYIEIRP